MQEVGDLHLGTFADGSGYALNLREPGGVKCLSASALAALAKHLATGDHAPLDAVPEHVALTRHGLLRQAAAPEKGCATSTLPSLTVWCHISNVCNLSCEYCYAGPSAQGAPSTQLMSATLARSAVDQVFDACKRLGFPRVVLKLAGGEPTLNIDGIAAICERARERAAQTNIPVQIQLITNGLFRHDALLPLLRTFAIGVSISVDGVSAESNRARLPSPLAAGALVLRRVLSTIRILGVERIPRFVLCTLTPESIEGLTDFADFCMSERVGFRLSLVRDARPTMQGVTLEETVSRLSAFYQRIAEVYPPDMPIARFARFGNTTLRRTRASFCGRGSHMIAIGHNGGLAACQMALARPIGALDNAGVFGALIRLREKNGGAVSGSYLSRCLGCPWTNVCRGGCPAHTEMMPEGPQRSPWCAVYSQVLPSYVRAVATQGKRFIRIPRSRQSLGRSA
jgi:radical SAM protein with 4Fe4S-binding SPASM domain